MTVLAELGLTQVAEGTIVRHMLTIGDAIDLWLGDLSRSGKAKRTQDTYSRYLDKFADSLPYHWDVAKITPAELRRFLDGYSGHSANTRCQVQSILNGFFEWLRLNEYIKRNPMDKIPRTKKPASDTLDVVTVSAEDVPRMLAAARGWTEKLSVAIPAYTGARRRACAALLVSDYDPEKRTLRFREKGGKVVVKPVPAPLAELIEARLTSVGASEVTAGDRRCQGPRPDAGGGFAGRVASPDDFLIPNESSQRIEQRDDRVIWAAVKRAAKRAGVDCHVHALRAAFAVHYLEQNPGDLEALQPLMGHRRIDTTQVYLRRLNRDVAMERVRDFTWA